MKLVIEIDDKLYEEIKDRNNTCGIYIPHGYASIHAIENGIPLPKGHGDLKDADIYKAEVKKYITENKNSDDMYLAGCGDGAYHALHIYDFIPTIIEEEVDKE